jgi:hypothetical protein
MSGAINRVRHLMRMRFSGPLHFEPYRGHLRNLVIEARISRCLVFLQRSRMSMLTARD